MFKYVFICCHSRTHLGATLYLTQQSLCRSPPARHSPSDCFDRTRVNVLQCQAAINVDETLNLTADFFGLSILETRITFCLKFLVRWVSQSATGISKIRSGCSSLSSRLHRQHERAKTESRNFKENKLLAYCFCTQERSQLTFLSPSISTLSSSSPCYPLSFSSFYSLPFHPAACSSRPVYL